LIEHRNKPRLLFPTTLGTISNATTKLNFINIKSYGTGAQALHRRLHQRRIGGQIFGVNNPTSDLAELLKQLLSRFRKPRSLQNRSVTRKRPERNGAPRPDSFITTTTNNGHRSSIISISSGPTSVNSGPESLEIQLQRNVGIAAVVVVIGILNSGRIMVRRQREGKWFGFENAIVEAMVVEIAEVLEGLGREEKWVIANILNRSRIQKRVPKIGRGGSGRRPVDQAH
ncbi:hypothetical protein PanWU01x14_156490, partial [Parasponia andersonii]